MGEASVVLEGDGLTALHCGQMAGPDGRVSGQDADAWMLQAPKATAAAGSACRAIPLIVEGSNTRAPLELPRRTVVSACAARVIAREAATIPAVWAAFCRLKACGFTEARLTVERCIRTDFIMVDCILTGAGCLVRLCALG